MEQLRQDVTNLRRDISTSNMQQDSHRRTIATEIQNVECNLEKLQSVSEERHNELKQSTQEKFTSVASSLQQVQDGVDGFRTASLEENQKLSKDVSDLREEIQAMNQNCQTKVHGALSDIQSSVMKLSKELTELKFSLSRLTGGGTVPRYQRLDRYMSDSDVVSVHDVGASLSGSNLSLAEDFDNGEARPVRVSAKRLVVHNPPPKY